MGFIKDSGSFQLFPLTLYLLEISRCEAMGPSGLGCLCAVLVDVLAEAGH